MRRERTPIYSALLDGGIKRAGAVPRCSLLDCIVRQCARGRSAGMRRPRLRRSRRQWIASVVKPRGACPAKAACGPSSTRGGDEDIGITSSVAAFDETGGGRAQGAWPAVATAAACVRGPSCTWCFLVGLFTRARGMAAAAPPWLSPAPRQGVPQPAACSHACHGAAWGTVPRRDPPHSRRVSMRTRASWSPALIVLAAAAVVALSAAEPPRVCVESAGVNVVADGHAGPSGHRDAWLRKVEANHLCEGPTRAVGVHYGDLARPRSCHTDVAVCSGAQSEDQPGQWRTRHHCSAGVMEQARLCDGANLIPAGRPPRRDATRATWAWGGPRASPPGR